MVWYLFIDQNSSDKVISGLIVKIVSEELSNLKKRDDEERLSVQSVIIHSFDFNAKWKLTCGEQMLM